MVGYGSHTRVPHMSSPLFSWLAYWMEVALPTAITLLIVLIFLVVLIALIALIVLIILIVLILIILFLILIRIWNG